MILSQMYIEINENDTYRTLLQRVDHWSKVVIITKLNCWYAGNLSGHEQDVTKIPHYGKRTPEMGEMQLDWPIQKIKRYVRALTKPCK